LTASRLLAGVLQSLLAFLLLAGSPVDALTHEARPLVRGIETAPNAIRAQRSSAAIPAEALIEPPPDTLTSTVGWIPDLKRYFPIAEHAATWPAAFFLLYRLT
jgi:hypothetical protein